MGLRPGDFLIADNADVDLTANPLAFEHRLEDREVVYGLDVAAIRRRAPSVSSVIQTTTVATMRGGGRPASAAALVIAGTTYSARPRGPSGNDGAVGETAGEAQHVWLKGAEKDRRPLDITEVEATDHRQPLAANSAGSPRTGE